MATVCWQRNGVTSTKGPAARLLHLQALHQRHHCYVPLFDHIPGTANTMSDNWSRLWEITDSILLARFNHVYPQIPTWHLYQLHMPMCFTLTLALLTDESGQALPTDVSRSWTNIGSVGMHYVWSTILNHTF
jgi:hypothetical protein